MAIIDTQLMTLLNVNRSNPTIAYCLDQISGAGEIRYQGNGLAPLNEIIEIYARRERINSELNEGIVKGFDELLPALEAATVSSVKLHSIEFLSQYTGN